MLLTFSSQIEASDQERRVIAGQVVPFDQVGMTSAGPVIFKRGSISIVDPNKIKLLANHDNKEVVGRATSFHTTDTGIYGSFKVSASSKGTDYLILAAEDLVSGLSVGVDVIKSAPDTKGNLVVTAGRLIEVSLVEAPAFAAAQIDRVAASETTQTEPTKESEAVMTTAPEAPQEEVKAEEAPVVEAARPRITTPNFTTAPRSPIVTGANYLEHFLRAEHGNEDSRQYVRAADDSFTTNPAFSPVAYVKEVAKNTTGIRPVIDACGGTRPLPPFGMTVSIPKITTNTTSATVAEGASVTGTTQLTSAYVDATVIKKSGYGIYSLELLERSDPSFFEILLENMRDAYAVASDAYVIAEITSGGTASATYGATLAGLTSFISVDAVAAYAATKRVATNLAVGTSWWTFLIAAQDTTTRSLFTAAQPFNASGDAAPTTLRGSVMGLDLYVDPNMVSTSIDESMFIIEKKSIEIYESPMLKLQNTLVATGQYEVSLNGFLAAKTIFSGGLRRFNLT